jgi:hypothetical protein
MMGAPTHWVPYKGLALIPRPGPGLEARHKSKVVPLRHADVTEARCNSRYTFLTSALDWMSGKGPPVPIVQEAGWAPEPVWTQRLEEKSFDSAGD